MFLRLCFLAAAALLTLNGCKSSPKSSATISQGNASNIHFIDPEDAGGPVRTKRYR